MTTLADFEKTCFVIMPFGKKQVGTREVDFNFVYNEIFEPAIQSAKLPEGGQLEPRRTDVDKFSSSISQDMFEYILYSRMAFTDISGFNPNVFYELGIRHSAQESGTVIFRQADVGIPFDIGSIKVFDYGYDTNEQITTSRQLISDVLTASLERNRLDSPVRLALRAQRVDPPTQPPSPQQQPVDGGEIDGGEIDRGETRETIADPTPFIDILFHEAEEALRIQDWVSAGALYKASLRLQPSNLLSRMRLGLSLKQQGRLYDALEQFSYLTQVAPEYSEAWREKGVVESRIYRLVPPDRVPGWLPSGETSLQKATALNPEDFDAWASWGGVLRRQPGKLQAALEKYQRSAEVSKGHPYPLLNALKLEAQLTGKLDLTSRNEALKTAEELRKGQALNEPPTETPWCYFDLAEIRLYRRDREGFLSYLDQGTACAQKGDIETFHNALQPLVDMPNGFAALKEGMKRLEQAMNKTATQEAAAQAEEVA